MKSLSTCLESNPNILFLNLIIGVASRKFKERVHLIKGGRGLPVEGIQRSGRLQLVLWVNATYEILKGVFVDFPESKFCAKSDRFR